MNLQQVNSVRLYMIDSATDNKAAAVEQRRSKQSGAEAQKMREIEQSTFADKLKIMSESLTGPTRAAVAALSTAIAVTLAVCASLSWLFSVPVACAVAIVTAILAIIQSVIAAAQAVLEIQVAEDLDKPAAHHDKASAEAGISARDLQYQADRAHSDAKDIEKRSDRLFEELSKTRKQSFQRVADLFGAAR